MPLTVPPISRPTFSVMSPSMVILVPLATFVLDAVGVLPSVVYTSWAPLLALTAVNVACCCPSYSPEGRSTQAVSMDFSM